MTYDGIVQNGVIVIPNGPTLPEGAKVVVAMVPPEVPSDTNGNIPTDQETICQKLSRLAREHENRPTSLPHDLAVNHDHYLHGTPKRQ